MNSFGADAMESLIDWSTPETIKNKYFDEQTFNNNPFDVMEMKAASMDPFDIVPDNSPTTIEPPCGNILSPMWEPKVRRIKKSVSMSGIDEIEHKKINICDKQDFKFEKLNETKEIDKENCLSSSCNDLNQLEISNNEEEIQLLKEKTQQRIKLLIENSKKLSREKYEQNSTMSSPQNKNKTETSLNKTDSFLNKAFRQNSLESSSTALSNSILYKNEQLDINDNNTSIIVNLADEVYNSFDLNSLKPEWVVDNFSDSDASFGLRDIQKDTIHPDKHKVNDCCIDTKIKAFGRIGIVNTKLAGNQTIVKSSKLNKINTHGPIVAHIPVKDMIQNTTLSISDKVNTSLVSPPVQIKPVASSTPTTADTVTKVSSNTALVKTRSLPKSMSSPKSSFSPKQKNLRTSSLGKLIIKNGTQNNSQAKNAATSLLKKSMQIDSDLKKTNVGKSKVFPAYKRLVHKGKENVKP